MIEGNLGKPPGGGIFTRDTWNLRLVAGRICDGFDITCNRRMSLRVAHRHIFSVRKPRPFRITAPRPKIRQHSSKRHGGIAAKWKKEGRVVLVLDVGTIRDSPTPRKEFRRRGRSDTIRANYSKNALNIIGMLGGGTVNVQFHDNLRTDICEYARRYHKWDYAQQRRRPDR